MRDDDEETVPPLFSSIDAAVTLPLAPLVAEAVKLAKSAMPLLGPVPAVSSTIFPLSALGPHGFVDCCLNASPAKTGVESCSVNIALAAEIIYKLNFNVGPEVNSVTVPLPFAPIE